MVIRNEGFFEKNRNLDQIILLKRRRGQECDIFDTEVWEVVSGKFHLSRAEEMYL